MSVAPSQASTPPAIGTKVDLSVLPDPLRQRFIPSSALNLVRAQVASEYLHVLACGFHPQSLLPSPPGEGRVNRGLADISAALSRTGEQEFRDYDSADGFYRPRVGKTALYIPDTTVTAGPSHIRDQKGGILLYFEARGTESFVVRNVSGLNEPTLSIPTRSWKDITFSAGSSKMESALTVGVKDGLKVSYNFPRDQAFSVTRISDRVQPLGDIRRSNGEIEGIATVLANTLGVAEIEWARDIDVYGTQTKPREGWKITVPALKKQQSPTSVWLFAENGENISIAVVIPGGVSVDKIMKGAAGKAVEGKRIQLTVDRPERPIQERPSRVASTLRLTDPSSWYGLNILAHVVPICQAGL